MLTGSDGLMDIVEFWTTYILDNHHLTSRKDELNLILKYMVPELINLIAHHLYSCIKLMHRRKKTQAPCIKEIRSKMSLYNCSLYNQICRG